VVEICEETGKVVYSRVGARHAVNAIKRRGAGRYSMTEYRCDFCRGWHIGHPTSAMAGKRSED